MPQKRRRVDFIATGLDGSNPLGFLAAVGLLRILDQQARSRRTRSPGMSWIEEGTWHPAIEGAGSVDDVVSAVMEDRSSWTHDPALSLAYDETGSQLVDPHLATSKAVRDLKPKPAAMRAFHARMAFAADEPPGEGSEWRMKRRSMYTAAAYASEAVQDNNGNTKPFAFHFTAGQQKFLEAIARIHEGVTADDVREAIVGPWRGASVLPTMSWDSTVARIYALRANDPSAEKRGGNPGADWLAFNALPLLLATPARGQLMTTGVRGGWKDSSFTWPIWDGVLTCPVIRSLLATRELPGITATQRSARGVAVVLSSGITRSDQGGYGGFSPARVVT